MKRSDLGEFKKEEKMGVTELTMENDLRGNTLTSTRRVMRVETMDSSVENTDRKEYEQLKAAFLNSSRHSMAQQINKYL